LDGFPTKTWSQFFFFEKTCPNIFFSLGKIISEMGTKKGSPYPFFSYKFSSILTFQEKFIQESHLGKNLVVKRNVEINYYNFNCKKENFNQNGHMPLQTL
jgi:hypothetical protein